MSDISTITITGNMTRDPEQKTTGGGRSVVEFTVANGRWRREAGSEQPTFYRVSIWNEGQMAYLMSKAQRGTFVTVSGEYDQVNKGDKVYNDISKASFKLGARQKGQQVATRDDTPRHATPQQATTIDNHDDIPF